MRYRPNARARSGAGQWLVSAAWLAGRKASHTTLNAKRAAVNPAALSSSPSAKNSGPARNSDTTCTRRLPSRSVSQPPSCTPSAAPSP